MNIGGRVKFVVVLGMLGCSRHSVSCLGLSTSPTAQSPAISAEVAKILETELPPEEDAGDASMMESVIDLVRRDAWDDAATALDALPPEQKRKATVRLVTGRVAMARGDYQAAVQAFTGLETDLAPIADDIEKWLAEAESNVGPYDRAARYFLKQGGAKSLARAALTFDKAGMTDDAKNAADKALAAGKGDAAEMPVRALRARLAEAAGQNDAAADDLRFIVLRAPAGDEAKAALASLQRLDPSHPLTGKERMARAERLVDAGRTDDALAELDLAKKAAAPPSDDDIAWAHAFALYRARGRYDRAASEFTKLGSQKGSRQAEALFHAARALSRADHDDEAAAGYAAVARRFPASPWADEATYLAARLAFLHAAWGEASAQYVAYLRKFPNGKQRDSATYERALALLANGKYTSARTELHTLAIGASSVGEAARLRELEGLAASKAGDKDGATSLFQEVIRMQPLSWAATAARGRLLQQGAEALPVIELSDGKPADTLSYQLPAIAELYHRLGLDSDAENYLKAHEKEAVASLGGRDKQGLCAMYGDLGRAARLYRIGVDAVPAAVLTRAPSKASEWAWKCLYPTPYVDRIRDLETRESLPPGFIYAVMRQESAYDPDAVSGARAVGLLQLMPDTARRVAAEAGAPFDEKLLRTPAVNLDLGARYLAKMLHTFDGNIPLAAAAYNAGPRAVRRWLERMKGVELDVWVALIPFDETRTYVNKVMSNLARYAYLEGGEGAVPTVDLALPIHAKEEAAEY